MSPSGRYRMRMRACRTIRNAIVWNEGRLLYQFLDAFERTNCRCIARQFNCIFRKFIESYLAERAHQIVMRQKRIAGVGALVFSKIEFLRNENRKRMQECVHVLRYRPPTEHERARFDFKQADYCFHLQLIKLSGDDEFCVVWKKLAKRKESLFHSWPWLTANRMEAIIREHDDYVDRVIWPSSERGIRRTLSRHLDNAMQAEPTMRWMCACGG
jgi:DNA-binding GntR family transcriptional regulator